MYREQNIWRFKEDGDKDHFDEKGLEPARGLVFGLAISAAFWVGLFAYAENEILSHAKTTSAPESSIAKLPEAARPTDSATQSSAKPGAALRDYDHP